MNAAVPTTAFLDELEKYGLLSPSQFKAARGLCAAPEPDARTLAAELMRRGWVTPFQVNQVLQGRAQGLVLGPYLLLERIGQGGMGQVFKARHTLMDRLVALKVIRADRQNQQESLARFRREMQAAAKLAHPNVVLAHDAALAGDDCYLAMEYIEGADLSQLLARRGRLPPQEACDYVRQAALGLQHAHERGLVHRDVKPSNLILTAAGNVVKVLDLGLARLRIDLDRDTTASGLTREGAVMGTPDYIAPEQAADARTADIRADVYSLGCTLYHLLAGRPPFPGGSLTEKLLRHQQAEPEAIERLRPEVSPDLARVVRRMMAKRPQDRYQTPREVADALAPFASPAVAHAVPLPEGPAAPEAESVRGSGTPTKTWEPRTGPRAGAARGRSVRRTAFVLGLAVLFLALVGVLILFLWPGQTPAPQGRAGDPLRADPAVPVPPAEKPAEVKNLPALGQGAARLIKELKGHTGTVQCLAFSADGLRLASGGDDEQARLWGGRTGEEKGKPLAQGAAVMALAFSPDGGRLATAGYGLGLDASVKIWDLAAGSPARTLPNKNQPGAPLGGEVHSVAFSPDGKHLAAGGGPLRLWDLDKGGEPAMFAWQKGVPSHLCGLAFSPDGKAAAADCQDVDEAVRVWPVGDAGDPLLLQGDKDAWFGHSDIRAVVAYVAGGKRLVRVTAAGPSTGFEEAKASVRVWDVDPERRRYTLRDTFKIPDGTVFALTAASDGHLRVAVAAGIPGPGAGLRIGPEPSKSEVKVWDEETRKVRAFETGHKDSVAALAFSPDGTRLATGSADQSARLWDLTH